MYNPRSTYRIQFNKSYTFENFKNDLEYFDMLGPGTIYASPVLAAVPGSVHGYDVTSPNAFNPEIGSGPEFDRIIAQLKSLNIGWLQDIVPNHMAFHMNNEWLMDVLQHGDKSTYLNYFDIDLSHPDFQGKLMVPFLGKTLQKALEDGEIKLDMRNGVLGFAYYDFFFPVKEETEKSIAAETGRPISNAVLKSLNDDSDRIRQLLDQQHYQLAYWKETGRHLNSRRFFTINSLICLKMEDIRVFNLYHELIAALVKENKIDGLRIDHIDGLREPTQYLKRLRALVGAETYLIAEKILERDEELLPDWPIQGSTGYDFLALVNNLLTYRPGYDMLRKFYTELTGIKDNPDDIIYQKKKLILTQSMEGDLKNLFRLFNQGDFNDLSKQAITPDQMKKAIGEFLLAIPVYKLYSDTFPLAANDRKIIEYAINQAEGRSPELKPSLGLIRDIFLGNENLEARHKADALQFFLRCMQFTGPLMAKGIEDTGMYYYNCFIAHNEVGDATDADGLTVSQFHDAMLRRREMLPMSLNTTATHDTKRGEDVRARLNVISELSGEWMQLVKKWVKINKCHKTEIMGVEAPTVNEEYFIYQSLVGVFPFDGQEDESLQKRLDEYFVKALREARMTSDWDQPNEAHEQAVINFTHQILNSVDFMNLFRPFQKLTAWYGINNSLAQLVLKATCPGIPDFYQGTELWDLSMVDPDNRRPVDYGHLKKMLDSLIREQHEQTGDFIQNMAHDRKNGQLKMWFTNRLLKERSYHPDLFIHGAYLPLTIDGKHKDHILSFARNYNDTWFVVIAPLYMAVLQEPIMGDENTDMIGWADTRVLLPAKAPENWVNIFDESMKTFSNEIPLSQVMNFPFAVVLKGKTGFSAIT